MSAWAWAHRMIPGQTKVDAKSNEITAIPELLRALEVSGCIVTIDAMGCQKEIAQTITKQGADYVLALKKNQPQLYQEVKDTFNLARQAEFAGIRHDFHETLEKSHGRQEFCGHRTLRQALRPCSGEPQDKRSWRRTVLDSGLRRNDRGGDSLENLFTYQ